MKTSKIIDNYLDIFFVSAVTSVLVTRFYLRLTNYFQLSYEKLHFAHVLWGGLFMTVAILLLLTYYTNRTIRHLAAVFGGLGFGLFIDELGKFITKDNNYFFQPTIAIIYAIFVILYLSIRIIQKHNQNSQNHLSLSINNPLKIEQFLSLVYQKTIRTHRFSYLIITYFSAQSIINLGQSLLTLLPYPPTLPFILWGELISSVISGSFVILGITRIRSRLFAYRMFRYSVLISILLTQFFVFYQNQLSALTGLTINLISFFALNYLIDQEKLYRHTHPLTHKH
jgi:hypothetical protein